jgi:sterol desaturase/sphingolipid hydroxylase (fatty acid hydroxylase superfamily)
MTTDAVVRFAVGWLALVAWTIVAFAVVERMRPRHVRHPRAGRVATAAGLLAIDAAIARAIVHGVQGGRVVLVWLLGEVLHYAFHRAMHRVPQLWRFHRLHHQDVPLTWTTTWFVHPMDAGLTACCAVAAALLVGGGLPTALWYVVGRRVWSIVLHANIAWPATVFDSIVATPAFHARHHREDLPPANFASTLPVLDRVFGTYR